MTYSIFPQIKIAVKNASVTRTGDILVRLRHVEKGFANILAKRDVCNESFFE